VLDLHHRRRLQFVSEFSFINHSVPQPRPDKEEARLSPGFRAAAYLLLVFTSGVTGVGAVFSGCTAGVTTGAFTSGFGVSAARIAGLVMVMTFHVQPRKISKKKFF
jgi:hypothetical protein